MDSKELIRLVKRYQFFKEDRDIIKMSMESGVHMNVANSYIKDIEDMWKYTLSVVPSFHVLTHNRVVCHIVNQLLNARNEALCLMARAAYLPDSDSEDDDDEIINGDYDEWQSAGDAQKVNKQKSPVSAFSHAENSLFKPIGKMQKTADSGKNVKPTSKRSSHTAFGDADTFSVTNQAKIFKPVATRPRPTVHATTSECSALSFKNIFKRSSQTAFAETCTDAKPECSVVKRAKVFKPVLKRPILDAFEMACDSKRHEIFKPVLTGQDKKVMKDQRIVYIMYKAR